MNACITYLIVNILYTLQFLAMPKNLQLNKDSDTSIFTKSETIMAESIKKSRITEKGAYTIKSHPIKEAKLLKHRWLMKMIVHNLAC